MTEEKRLKWRMRKNKAIRVGKGLLAFLVPTAIVGTIGAAWCGYKRSEENAKRLDAINDRLKRDEDVVDNNANCQRYDRQRLDELTRQQNLLLEKALMVTEGKEEENNKEDAA